MENFIIKELCADWKNIKNFLVFLKKNANWLCLVVDDYDKECAVHGFLIRVEDTLKVEWGKNDAFEEFATKKTILFFCLFKIFMILLKSIITMLI